MCPYIITTKTPNPGDCGDPNCESCNQDVHPVVSRRAVATLDEALDAVREAGGSTAYVMESGGTVGPLPDGTVIEVERMNAGALAARAKLDPIFVFGEGRMDNAEIIDAYNEAQS